MNKKFYLTLILCSFAIALTSCGLYEDFTTYFNTYYNTKEQFDEAMLEVLPLEKELFSDKILAVQSGSQKFTTVIEKCSKILQYNSNSSFVDNALNMIGISYYYQREYPSAIRKFNELISNLPDSKFSLEAKLWIAKCDSKMNENKKAVQLLEGLIKESIEKENDDITANCYLELMKIAYIDKDLEKVIFYGQKYIENKNDNEIASQVMLEVGVSQDKLGQTEQALKSIEAVDDFSPTYKTKFKCSLATAKVLRELKRTDEAMEIIEDIKDNPLYEEFLDQIYFEHGNIFFAMKDYKNAFDKYRYCDTVYSRSESGGLAQFQLASYLENQLNNLDSAKYYYDRASVSSASKEITLLSFKKSQVLTKRKNLNESIQKVYERIITLRKFQKDSTNFPSKEVVVDSAKLSDSVYMASYEQELKQKIIADSLYSDRLNKDTLLYKSNLKIADSIRVDIAKSNYELASLYLTDLELPDSSIFFFKYVSDSFPKTELAIKSKYALANLYEKTNKKELADSLFKDLLSANSQPEIVKSVSKKLNVPLKNDSLEIPKDEFYKSELFVKEKQYDKAIEKLSQIVKDFPKTDYAPKSLLTIGHIYENYLKKYDKAAGIYDSLIKNFQTTKYAVSITNKLSVYKEEQAKIEAEKKAAEEKKKAELAKIKEEEEKKKAEAAAKKELKKSSKDSTTLKSDTLKNIISKEDSTKNRMKESEPKNIQEPERDKNLFQTEPPKDSVIIPEQKIEDPKTDEPKVIPEQKIEDPKTDEPKVIPEQKIEEPKTDEPKVIIPDNENKQPEPVPKDTLSGDGK